MRGWGFRIEAGWSSWFEGSGFRVSGLEFRVQGSEIHRSWKNDEQYPFAGPLELYHNNPQNSVLIVKAPILGKADAHLLQRTIYGRFGSTAHRCFEEHHAVRTTFTNVRRGGGGIALPDPPTWLLQTMQACFENIMP